MADIVNPDSTPDEMSPDKFRVYLRNAERLRGRGRGRERERERQRERRRYDVFHLSVCVCLLCNRYDVLHFANAKANKFSIKWCGFGSTSKPGM
jgi:hypothetical protein